MCGHSKLLWLVFCVETPLPRRVFSAPSTLPLRSHSSAATVSIEQRDTPSSFPNKPLSMEKLTFEAMSTSMTSRPCKQRHVEKVLFNIYSH